jgi:hypothetical protein
VTVPVFWASFVVRQMLSWRRAPRAAGEAGGERQAQLKWLMAGGAVTVIGLTGTVALQSASTLLTLLDNICLALAMFSLPVCISFAILKYHLYDIDRVISRTLSYTLVTGLLITRCATGCSGPSTAGSTGPGTTLTAWWLRSQPG